MDPIIATSPIATLGLLSEVAHQPGDHGNELVQPLAASQLAARIGKHLVDFPSHTRHPSGILQLSKHYGIASYSKVPRILQKDLPSLRPPASILPPQGGQQRPP